MEGDSVVEVDGVVGSGVDVEVLDEVVGDVFVVDVVEAVVVDGVVVVDVVVVVVAVVDGVVFTVVEQVPDSSPIWLMPSLRWTRTLRTSACAFPVGTPSKVRSGLE